MKTANQQLKHLIRFINDWLATNDTVTEDTSRQQK